MTFVLQADHDTRRKRERQSVSQSVGEFVARHPIECIIRAINKAKDSWVYLFPQNQNPIN